MCIVVVEPVDAGWSVNIEGVDNPMMFTSGRAAEQAGRDLALRMAGEGHSVRLEVRLRGGAVAGRFLVLPPADLHARPVVVPAGGPGGEDQQEADPPGQGRPITGERRSGEGSVAPA